MNFQNLWRKWNFFLSIFYNSHSKTGVSSYIICLKKLCLEQPIVMWLIIRIIYYLYDAIVWNSFYKLLLWIFWQEFNNFFSFILQVVKEEKISVVDMQKLRQIIIILTKRLWKRKEENKIIKKWMVCPLCLKASVGF